MVGALGVVANSVANSRQRRDSRNSQHNEDGDGRVRIGSRATVSEILNSRHILASGAVPPSGGLHFRDPGGNKGDPAQTPKDPDVPLEKLSLKEQVKFYVSLLLGILASICVFALLFLIPLVVEPSISTLVADFDPTAATCVTIDSSVVTGLTKCGSFSSCREGCTSTPSQCYQIYVNYRRTNRPGYNPIKNFTMLPAQEYMDESRWDVAYTQLLVNVKGCGYPPRVKCDEFGEIFGKDGRTFPCYYSRANPRLVVTDYNWEETAYPLLFSLGIPTIIFSLSISVLSFWYCPSCEERGKNKRPCRSRYTIPRPKPSDILKDEKPRGQGQKREVNDVPPVPVVNQPRRKHSAYQPNSPSLATISSGDTTVSSCSSLDSGWQSPPSPPPRLGSRMNNSTKSNISTRVRKL